MDLYTRFYSSTAWCNKYRPTNFDDLIVPESLKKYFNGMVETGEVPNLLLYGRAGIGKTSIAIILTKMLDRDFLYINGSVENSIDLLRGNLTQFVSTVSFSGGKKIVIIDESDRMSKPFQDGMKSFLEEFSKSCSFVFITNNINLVIEPLQSRLETIDFNFSDEEVMSLKKQFGKRILDILKQEGVSYDKKVLGFLINLKFPDQRKCLNEIQKYARQGRLSDPSVIQECSNDIGKYYTLLKGRNYHDITAYLVGVSDVDQFFSKLYETLLDYVDESNIPEMVILVKKYCYEKAFVVDNRIILSAFSFEVMRDIKLK